MDTKRGNCKRAMTSGDLLKEAALVTAASVASLALSFLVLFLLFTVLGALLGFFQLSASAEDTWVRALAVPSFLLLLLLATTRLLRGGAPDWQKAGATAAPYAFFYLVLAGNLGAGLLPALGIGALFFLLATLALKRLRLPWPYFYTLSLVSLAMLVLVLLG